MTVVLGAPVLQMSKKDHFNIESLYLVNVVTLHLIYLSFVLFIL